MTMSQDLLYISDDSRNLTSQKDRKMEAFDRKLEETYSISTRYIDISHQN